MICYIKEAPIDSSYLSACPKCDKWVAVGALKQIWEGAYITTYFGEFLMNPCVEFGRVLNVYWVRGHKVHYR